MHSDIRHRTLAGAVLERLREQILSNTYPAGTQLRQDALAGAFGVSRIPIREALIQLEAEGLIQLVPHKGAIVTELSREEVNDVFDLRAMLETRLFADSIPRLKEADFAAIDTLQARFEAALRERDLARWGVLNQELHAALYARAQLPQTSTVVATLLQKSDRYTRVQLSSDSARRRAEREHGRLIELARQKKIDQACECLVDHIETVRQDLLGMLGRTTSGANAPTQRTRRQAGKTPVDR